MKKQKKHKQGILRQKCNVCCMHVVEFWLTILSDIESIHFRYVYTMNLQRSPVKQDSHNNLLYGCSGHLSRFYINKRQN